MKRFILLAFLLPLVFAKTKAQPGRLDSSFGTNGHIDLQKNVQFADFQSNGKFVGIEYLDSQLHVYHFDTNGSPDPSFEEGVSVNFTSLPAGSSRAGLVVGNDGKIIVLNGLPKDSPFNPLQRYAVVRFNSSGKLDSTFNEDGIAIGYFGSNGGGLLNKLAVTNEGDIFFTAFGFIKGPPGGSRLGLHHYSNEGAFSYGELTAYPQTFQNPLVYPEENGKIVVGATGVQTGYSYPFNTFMVIWRRKKDGTPDTSFGSGGQIVQQNYTNPGVTLSPIAIATDRFQKIIVAVGSGRLLRLKENGSLDSSFGSAGFVTPEYFVTKIAIQDDGKILVGGNIDSSFTITRYSDKGELDQTFGTAGRLLINFGTGGGISDMTISGDRLYAYGRGILAAYLLNEPQIVGPESNTTSGNYALSSNTSGLANTAYGANALQANTTGSGNTGIGYNSMYSNVTGTNNTATGGAALGLNTSGSKNAAFGVGAGFSQNNSSSTFIGTLADATIPVTNSTALGYQSTVNASNQVRIGNSAVTSIGGFSNWTNLSDGRLKKNVSEDVPGLTFITQLRPVTYNLDLDGIDTKLRTNMTSRPGAATNSPSILPPSAKELQAKVEKAKVRYTGFVAQEVEQAAKKLGYDFSGVDVPKSKDGMYGLRYAEFVVPLVKAVQEQQKEIQELKELVAKLSGGATPNNTNNTTIPLSNAYLEQNYPNPQTGNTLIRYHLPAATTNAKVVITDMKGQVIKSIDLNSRGDGQINLDAATLAAGTYNYSLWIGGKEVDTKRMVVGR
jgi:uncharacterized delta-60 repeat protein